MDATADLTPDELLAADRLFAALLGEQEDHVFDLAQRALRRLDGEDDARTAEAV